MHQIFWLSPSVRSSDRLLYTNEMSFITKLCEHDPSHAKLQRRSAPLKVIAPISPLSDFQWTPYNELVVTKSVMEKMLAAKIRGAKFLEVKTFLTSGIQTCQEIKEVRTEGWGGVAQRNSGIQLLSQCPYCKRSIFSAYRNASQIFNFDDWDGSDLFAIWPIPRYIFVTGRVRDMILDDKLSGVEVKALSDLPQPITSTLTPGSLFDWYDRKKAIKLQNYIN